MLQPAIWNLGFEPWALQPAKLSVRCEPWTQQPAILSVGLEPWTVQPFIMSLGFELYMHQPFRAQGSNLEHSMNFILNAGFELRTLLPAIFNPQSLTRQAGLAANN